MKTRMMLLCCLICVAVSLLPNLSGPGNAANRVTEGPQKIAVIRILELLRDQAASDEHRKEMITERNQANRELEQLNRQANEAEQALKTFTVGTDDYIDQLGKVMEAQARLQSRKEFLDRQMSMKQQLWTQDTYNKIVRATTEVAQAKGYGVVLAADPNGLPLSETFSAMIAMQKVVYAGGCPDITEEVKARLKP